jgi:hypothetical protein
MGFTGIVGEIKKNTEVYTFNFNGEKDLDKIYKQLLGIAKGQEVYRDQEQIIDLRTGEYDHIRVYRAGHAGPFVEEPEKEPEKQRMNEGLEHFTQNVKHLGQKLCIKGVRGEIDGVPFLMVYQINDQDAIAAMSKKNLQELTWTVSSQLKLAGPVMITPHAAGMDDDEALEYVQDYADELAKETTRLLENKDKTAVAFNEWNKEE